MATPRCHDRSLVDPPLDTSTDDQRLIDQLGGATVADLMIRHPKTLPVTATVAQVRAAFEDDHVHMVLLTQAGVLRGTVVREDLFLEARDAELALAVSELVDRTVASTEPAAAACHRLLERGQRRLAVVDDDGVLVGLLCLKRRRTGLCSDTDVAARSEARGASAAR